MTTPILLFVAGLLTGALLGALLALRLRPVHSGSEQPKIAALEERLSAREAEITRLQQESAARQLAASNSQLEIGTLRAELQNAQLNAQKEITAFKDAQSTAEDRFAALAHKALRENTESFVEIATPEFEKKQKAVDDLIQPIEKALEKLRTETGQLEVKRESAYASVLTEIENIKQIHASIRKETSQLVQALRSPKARGDWGQMILKRCIEFAGMNEHVDFDVEKYIRSETEKGYRPDCVINLPNDRIIIIDAKTVLDAFREAVIAADDGNELLRQEMLKAHAVQVRFHLDELESKAYWKQFQFKGSSTPDFVVCFLPSEGLFSSALEQDSSLIERGKAEVILATPTTLIALLKAVAYGWQQVESTRDAQLIRQTAVSIYEKMRSISTSFIAIGTGIKNAAKAWEGMRVQVEGRDGVFSNARKLNKLKVGELEIPEVKEITLDMTELQADDWQSDQFKLPENTK
jgi:DNA recombination protein RmuC